MRWGAAVGGVFFGAAALWACGSYGRADDGETPPAPLFDSGPGDAGSDAADVATVPPPTDSGTARCSLDQPFGTPRALSSIGSFTNLGGVRFSRDELTVYFWSKQRVGTDALASDDDLFVAHRRDVDDAFEDVQQMADLNTSDDDTAPSLTADELSMYFVRGPVGMRQLYVATRSSVNNAFATAQLLAVPPSTGSSAPDDSAPWVNPRGTTLYLTSNGRPAMADLDIFRMSLPSSTSSTFLPLPELRSGAVDSTPVLGDDELTIYFKTLREDPSGDIWVARRPSADARFDAPQKVAELSTANREAPQWLSPDGCVLYYVSETAVFSARRGR